MFRISLSFILGIGAFLPSPPLLAGNQAVVQELAGASA